MRWSEGGGSRAAEEGKWGGGKVGKGGEERDRRDGDAGGDVRVESVDGLPANGPSRHVTVGALASAAWLP